MKSKKPEYFVPTDAQCQYVSQILKNMAHPQRLMILCHLCGGPHSVSELEILSQASQSSVSQFLSKMKSDGLIGCRREKQNVIYDIDNPHVKKIVHALQKIFCV